MHFLAWIKQLLLQDVGLLCSLWFIAFTTSCHFLVSWLRCFWTPSFRQWGTAGQHDYIQTLKQVQAMFCCFSFFLHDIWVSWACCMMKYIYVAHARAVSSCCATCLKFMDFYLSQMGPIPQIFIYDHFWSSPSGAHKEPWLAQPCTSVGDLLGNSHEPWARLSLLRPGAADKKTRLHLQAGDTSALPPWAEET